MKLLVRHLRRLLQIGLLLPFWGVGVWVAPHLPIPIPGSLVGTGLLLIALQLRWVRPEWLEDGSSWLFRHMLLFFIPAALGVVSFPELLGPAGLRAVAVIAVSTVAVMTVTGAAVEWVGRRRSRSTAGTPSPVHVLPAGGER
ncbi:MAG: CidA/LrgA family protein [Anaeromyxobacter sp.]